MTKKKKQKPKKKKKEDTYYTNGKKKKLFVRKLNWLARAPSYVKCGRRLPRESASGGKELKRQ